MTRCALELTGKRFGRLVAVGPTRLRSGSNILWKCYCDCGKIVYPSACSLANGSTRSCGCLHRRDLSGQRFGKLVAVSATTKKGRVAWTCQCDCGDIIVVYSHSLVCGDSTSCGCYLTARGMVHNSTLLPDDIPTGLLKAQRMLRRAQKAIAMAD